MESLPQELWDVICDNRELAILRGVCKSYNRVVAEITCARCVTADDIYEYAIETKSIPILEWFADFRVDFCRVLMYAEKYDNSDAIMWIMDNKLPDPSPQ